MKYLVGTLSLIHLIFFFIDPVVNKNSIMYANMFYMAYLIMDNSDENMKVIKTLLENQQNPVEEEKEKILIQ